jgi:hypothetical protein
MPPAIHNIPADPLPERDKGRRPRPPKLLGSVSYPEKKNPLAPLGGTRAAGFPVGVGGVFFGPGGDLANSAAGGSAWLTEALWPFSRRSTITQ